MASADIARLWSTPYINRERYYKLKHFCRQYPIWKKAHAALDGLSKRPEDLALLNKTNQTNDPTARCAEARLAYAKKMEMVEKCAEDASPERYKYTMSYATKGDGYSVLKMRDHIPCGKDKVARQERPDVDVAYMTVCGHERLRQRASICPGWRGRRETTPLDTALPCWPFWRSCGKRRNWWLQRRKYRTN